MKKVLLYSGGMDSWLIDKLWKPDVKLFFNIGTENSNGELERVKKRNDVEIIDFPLSQFEEVNKNFYLPLRNLHFVIYAAHYGDVICLGATGSSTHRDKNDVFGTLSENVINYLLQEDGRNPVKIVMPYRNVSKTAILAEYIANGGDIEECYRETFSCYSPKNDGSPCMKCTSCQSKFTAFYNNGYQFSQDIIDEFVKNVLNDSNAKGDVKKLAMKLKYGNHTLCIDFDKTITDDTPWPKTGDIRPGCKVVLDKLKSKGFRLVLFTSRIGAEFDEAVEFCEKYHLPFDDYISGKPYAKYYLDDKALSVPDWRTFLMGIDMEGEA